MLASKKLPQTRHQDRFGITSFVYKARRPFHPDRVHEKFMENYFTFVVREDNGSDDSALEETGGQLSQEALEQRQQESAGKQEKRTTEMGNLLRTKGYIWMANAHDLVGHFEQAGNTVTLETPELWNALNPKSYSGSEKEKKKLRNNFEKPYGDRRQELVFIGKGLKHGKIQKLLDECLVTEEEYALGVDGWKGTMGDIILVAHFEAEDVPDDEEDVAKVEE